MKVKKGSLSDLILLYLEKTVDGYVRLEDFLYNTHIYARGYDRPLKKSALAQALKRLREKELLEEIFESGNLAYKLSAAGQDLLLFQHDEVEDWDGKWRIIIFDIPEKQRKIRRILRGKLKEWGFKPWQKSVWATRRNIIEKLKDLILELKISKWVALIESDNVFFKT
ncbi:hypothetical protein HYW44_02730 [Candidatus Daviesbacteria bacterium]|nr:hypothetical protein [Candidatus Daviesbacteria bacterium]